MQDKRVLADQYKTDSERLLEKHLLETTEMNEQFNRTRMLQDQQMELLQQRLQELQDLYDQRPSREEDLERIISLESELREKEVGYKRMYEEMQFFKKELINREQNYNKVFGANPQVGVIDPVSAKKRNSVGGNTTMRVVQPQNSMNGMNGMGAMNVGPPLMPGTGKRRTTSK